MTIAAKASLLHLSLVDAADALKREASITLVVPQQRFEPAPQATKEAL